MLRRYGNVLALAVITAGILAMIGGVYEAGTTVIDPISGHILSVEPFTDPNDPSIQGIEFRDHDPAGQTISEEIPSSFDAIIDRSPTLALNPAGGVVVVWSRFDGNDFELVTARRENGFWSNHSFLTSNQTNDTEPRLLIDSTEKAHILWWGNGVGGPVFLRSFDPLTGFSLSPRWSPLEPMVPKKPRSSTGGIGFNSLGGSDDPGVPTTSGSFTASALQCAANPLAVPDHGVVMSCNRPAAYQLSNCQLVVGVQDPATLIWNQTTANLGTADLSTTSVHEIVQTLADYQCGSQ